MGEKLKSVADKVRRILPSSIKRRGRMVLETLCGPTDQKIASAVDKELARLRSMPRYQATTTGLLGFPLATPDGLSFADMYREVYTLDFYKFNSSKNVPFIIDGGANIGLSIFYFKRLYPDSRIIAFEPDYEIFKILQQNVARSGYAEVDLICRALAETEKSVQFMAEGSYGGRIARRGDPRHKSVKTVQLSNYLNVPVDMLKLDIEGVETEVLAECSHLLQNVQNIAVEYHSFAGEPQALGRLISLLTDAGFRLQINQIGSGVSQPLVNCPVILGMDMQLAIFGYRL